MFVHFWKVGSSSVSNLPMTADQVSKHLTADWMPSFPVSISSSFVNWPQHLLEEGDDRRLLIKSAVGRSERQWKGVLSWMLGVAGARHVLEREHYRWVAPLSAFYVEAKQQVDIDWSPDFPPGKLKARKPARSRSRLRPDYIAIRETKLRGKRVMQWAVVESKGTRRCLTALHTCPKKWYKQARHVELAVDELPLQPQRYLVVATRMNPNAVRANTRTIQVRAWNSAEKNPIGLPDSAAVEIASAHLFGLLRNLGLWANARALALAPWRLPAVVRNGRELRPTEHRAELLEQARYEMRSQTGMVGDETPNVRWVGVETGSAALEVEMQDSVMTFCQQLQLAESTTDAVAAFNEVQRRLDEWQDDQSQWEQPTETGESVLPSGVRVRIKRRE